VPSQQSSRYEWTAGKSSSVSCRGGRRESLKPYLRGQESTPCTSSHKYVYHLINRYLARKADNHAVLSSAHHCFDYEACYCALFEPVVCSNKSQPEGKTTVSQYALVFNSVRNVDAKAALSEMALCYLPTESLFAVSGWCSWNPWMYKVSSRRSSWNRRLKRDGLCPATYWGAACWTITRWLFHPQSVDNHKHN
jgi:hypothetical protein